MGLCWFYTCLFHGKLSRFRYELWKVGWLIMAYYFQCNECGKKETFNLTKQSEEIKEGKKQDYETVVCTTCISKKVRLKGNYIIIWKEISWL